MITKPNATALVWEGCQCEQASVTNFLCLTQHTQQTCMPTEIITVFPAGENNCTLRYRAFLLTVNTHVGRWSTK